MSDTLRLWQHGLFLQVSLTQYGIGDRDSPEQNKFEMLKIQKKKIKQQKKIKIYNNPFYFLPSYKIKYKIISL
jgi:hypothetical protein